ncbi:MAG: hypothetical protein K2G30_00970 [Muribaculaceae bacterium]|nr:hypothetical protein [Muribaculaceae bacterium]
MGLRQILATAALSALSALFSAAAASGVMPMETVSDPPDFLLAAGESRVAVLDPEAGALRISVAADFPKKALAKRSAAVVLTLVDVDGLPVMAATLSIGEDPSFAGFDEPALRLVVDSIAPDGRRITVSDRYVGKDANTAGGVNSLVVESERGKMVFKAGGNRMGSAGEAVIWSPVASAELSATSEMWIRRFETRQAPDPVRRLMTAWTVESLAERFAASSDPVEGFWSFLDRDNDPRWAVPGGFYELAVVKADTEPASYDIIYLGGASVEGASWKSGMKKGTLWPTIFADHYRLGWTDARFQTDYPECTAGLSASNTILTLRFPLDHSEMRFSRRASDAR